MRKRCFPDRFRASLREKDRSMSASEARPGSCRPCKNESKFVIGTRSCFTSFLFRVWRLCRHIPKLVTGRSPGLHLSDCLFPAPPIVSSRSPGSFSCGVTPEQRRPAAQRGSKGNAPGCTTLHHAIPLFLSKNFVQHAAFHLRALRTLSGL
ncbi:hypothetical protein BC834DRAFT_508326 [Gloeopeniophorella convolvens]|nr:hypothetical protein BC834DRAFT_508326 [Gloeopeniophorella convolvens]